MALSLGGLGSSLAYVIIIPLTQFLIDVYGWRGTMLLTGGVYSHIAVCGALMKEPATTRSNDEYAAVAVVEETAVTGEGEAAASNSRCCSCQNSVSSFISKTLKKKILSSAPFWLIVFMMNIWMMMYTAWLIYFVPNTISKGFLLKEASTFVVTFGVGRIIASVTIGPLVQHITAISSTAWLGIGLLSSCIYYLADPWLLSYWPITVSTFVLGYFNSIPLVLFDVIIIETFGADLLGSVLGLIGIVAGVCRTLSLYFPGKCTSRKLVLYQTTFELHMLTKLVCVPRTAWGVIRR